MPPPKTKKRVSANETAQGGKLLEVELLNGKKENILVRHLRVKDYARLATFLDTVDEELCDFFIRKGKGWSENNLSVVSVLKIIDCGSEMVKEGFFMWLDQKNAFKIQALEMGLITPEKISALDNSAQNPD